MANYQPHSKAVRQFFFWTGIVATFCYRVIIILNNFNPLWLKLSWYIGTVGFIIYFAHRYQVSETREGAIVRHDLAKKVQDLEGLDENDKAALAFIFRSLKISTERWNYIFIFVTSGLALLAGVYLDFIKK